MKEMKNGWGTAGWLADHELGPTPAIVRCQRRTKVYEDVVRSLDAGPAIVKSVYRQKRDAGDLCAAFISGAAGSTQIEAFRELNATTLALAKRPCVVFAYVTTFLYDGASGAWNAIVVFKRRS